MSRITEARNKPPHPPTDDPKVCKVCGQRKPGSDFYADPSMASGRASTWKACVGARYAERYRRSDHQGASSKLCALAASGGAPTDPLRRHLALAEQGIDPACVVCFTDLDCRDFGQTPGYPVLWCLTLKTAAPFGEVVKLTL